MTRSLLHVKARPVRACKTIFAKWCGTFLSRGSYGVYAAVTGTSWLLRGLHASFCFFLRKLWVALTGQVCLKVWPGHLSTPCQNWQHSAMMSHPRFTWILFPYLCSFSIYTGRSVFQNRIGLRERRGVYEIQMPLITNYSYMCEQ